MKIYCDTDTLFNNIKDQPIEQAALERLLGEHRVRKIVMYRSLVNLREVNATKNSSQQQSLVADYEQLEPIAREEKVHGFHHQADQYGGFISYPLVDVQDEAVCRELEQRGLKHHDAQHITQAVCNRCDVFLTRDRSTIIHPYRSWLENRFPGLKIYLPSELATELGL